MQPFVERLANIGSFSPLLQPDTPSCVGISPPDTCDTPTLTLLLPSSSPRHPPGLSLVGQQLRSSHLHCEQARPLRRGHPVPPLSGVFHPDHPSGMCSIPSPPFPTSTFVDLAFCYPLQLTVKLPLFSTTAAGVASASAAGAPARRRSSLTMVTRLSACATGASTQMANQPAPLRPTHATRRSPRRAPPFRMTMRSVSCRRPFVNRC